MSARTQAQAGDAPPRNALGQALSRPLAWPRVLWEAIGQRASSSLTRRIVVLNLVGLIALLVGVFVPQPIPPGPDSGPDPEPCHPGRDHRRRDRGLGLGGHGRDSDRPRQAAPAAGRRGGGRGGNAAAYLLAQPREGGAAALAPRHAHGQPRPGLRPGGRAPVRHPDPVQARRRRSARPAGAAAAQARNARIRVRDRPVQAGGAVPHPSRADDRGDRPGQRPLAARGPGGTGRQPRQPRPPEQARRDQRVGGGADPPGRLSARRPADLHPGRFHRPGDRLGAVRPAAGVPRRLGRDGGAVVPSGGRDRRPGATPRGGRRESPHGHQDPRGDPGLHRAHRRDRPPLRGAARHDPRRSIGESTPSRASRRM